MSVDDHRGTCTAASVPVAAAAPCVLEEDAEDDGCGGGDNPARLRWAVNIANWHPEGDHEGEEFRFLLSLLPENEREDCLKMRFMPDKKRALVSRLLQRAACSLVARIPHAEVHIKRTRGRKPFLVRDFPEADYDDKRDGCAVKARTIDIPKAPNFNFNVSHEGDFVVLASEPSAICGVDVAAPGQARRRGKDGRMPTAKEMLDTFAYVFTPHEKEQILAASGTDGTSEADDNAKEEVFRRHWSLKESLVKAMGVGLALELGRAEFHTGDTAAADGEGGDGRVVGDEAGVYSGGVEERQRQKSEAGEVEEGGGEKKEGGWFFSSWLTKKTPRRSDGGSENDDEDEDEDDDGGDNDGDKILKTPPRSKRSVNAEDDDDDDDDDDDAKALKRQQGPHRCNRLLFSPSKKTIFVSDGGAGAGAGSGGDNPQTGRPGNSMETARLILDGVPRPRWRFFMQPLGESTPTPLGESGGGQHWVTVSRGPTEDVTDANGEFRASWRKPTFTDEEWKMVLAAPSPYFSLLSVADLVPENLRGAYENAGGEVFC